MSNSIFNPMEMDAIGEIMNISLGSSATAVSNMLDHRVDITTPEVEVVKAEAFSLGSLEPAIGVEIKYVSGLEGSNIMLLKMSDVKVIVDILMGTETTDEEFELNELTLSAVCEVMNQMMGAASTALSDFLGRMVNISTPQTFDVDDLDAFKRERLPVPEGSIVVVRFALKLEGAMESEFMNVMSVDLARELIAGFGLGDYVESPSDAAADDSAMSQAEVERVMADMAGVTPITEPEQAASGGDAMMSQADIERMMANMGGNAPAPAAQGASMSQEEIERLMGNQAAPAPAQAPAAQGASMSQEEIERMLQGGAGAAPQTAPPAPYGSQQLQAVPPGYPPYPPYPAPEGYPPYPPYYMGYPPYPPQEQKPEKTQPEPKVIQTQAAPLPHFENGEELPEEQAQNLDLIMAVPLEVTVEIGRTRKRVQDILSFTKGSLVVLDKLAGEQVDLFVNGKCIARGDVVVIDDNFGIRISEILRKPDIADISLP